ncbi:MAG TPA: Dna2/Cas4 domain-containing protein, partial [Candidatus Thalassarchaeaceae archaeon]|nr:Dna2/Cas4 domain-containing protein [Candidatus Thalassarchaeaceae archaeon]
MGEGKSVEIALELSGSIAEGTRREDGYWENLQGMVLPVSASDLERHTYCPVSWQLSKAGVSGEGDALEQGMLSHDRIHKKMVDFKRSETRASRDVVVWSWWITVVCALSADSAAFFFVNEGTIPEEFIQDIGRYLIILAGVWLVLAIALISLPWRRWLGRPFGLAQPPTIEGTGLQEEEMISPFDIGTETGIGKGGKTEVRLLLASIAVALHGLAIYWAENRSVLTFSLIVITLAWLLFSAWQLHRVLISGRDVLDAKEEAGLSKTEVLAYSDDSGESAALLMDDEIGLRGRPDQIVKIDNQFIPVEQKTGKVPIEPHDSHRMQLLAYLHLVSETTGTVPNYGILRYGGDSLFTVAWDDSSKAELHSSIQEIQRLMVEGGAKRNHERIGKCRNCSRR